MIHFRQYILMCLLRLFRSIGIHTKNKSNINLLILHECSLVNGISTILIFQPVLFPFANNVNKLDALPPSSCSNVQNDCCIALQKINLMLCYCYHLNIYIWTEVFIALCIFLLHTRPGLCLSSKPLVISTATQISGVM